VRHIAAGDLLRAEAQAGGRPGREIAACQARGDLVPDQIVLDVLTPAVTEAARPLVAHYAGRGILVRVNADQPPESVTAAIQAQLRQSLCL